MRYSLSVSVLFIFFAFYAALITRAEPDAPAADKETADKEVVKRWMNYYKQVAHGYDIRLKDHPDEKLKPSAEAVHSFVYSSHEIKPHGACFVWTREGRPEAIAVLWSHLVGDTRRRVVHDLHSLASGPLTAKWQDKVAWSPKGPGIEFMPVPKAEPPAKSARLRLAQMRSMAQEFKGFVTREKKVPLRLLPQPLYRYEASSKEVVDGAIFAFFDEWDPEILIVIEARSKTGTAAWSFAPVRFSEARLTLDYGDSQAWDDPPREFSDSTKVFYAPWVEDLDAKLKTAR